MEIFRRLVDPNFPTVLVRNLSLHDKNENENTSYYKRVYNDDVSKFTNCLSEVKWEELLDNINSEGRVMDPLLVLVCLCNVM